MNISKMIKVSLFAALIYVSFFAVIPSGVVAGKDDSSPTGLYAGSTDPGVVWEYKGGTNWESITEHPPKLGWSVTSIITYEGGLYAAAISDSDIDSSSGKVYRYDGDKKWTPVDNGLEVNQVTFLIVYKGELYAGTATPARLYKYNPTTTSWTKVLDEDVVPWFGFRSAYVWGDWLYLGEWYWDRFARWNGIDFQEFQPSYVGSCIYNFEEYRGNLYAGAYQGRIYKVTYELPIATPIWREPNYYYALTLKEFKGDLYIGFDRGYLYKYNGENFIPLTWPYIPATDNPHEGVISMATTGTHLYVGVGGEAVGYPGFMSGEGIGRVYVTSNGKDFDLISEKINMGTGAQTLYYARIQPIQAAQLAKKIIGTLYKWGKQGWYTAKLYYYFYTPSQIKEQEVDCSGLIFWSYNRAYYGEKGLKTSEWEKRPLYWFYAQCQYYGNTREIGKEELKQGDLIFFDEYPVGDDIMDHVAMYVMDFTYSGKKYNVIHATSYKEKEVIYFSEVIPAYYDHAKETLTTVKSGKTQVLTVDGYGRVIEPKKCIISARSPVDLIVIDPDGFIVTTETPISPGMCYMVYDIDGDSELDDIVGIPERKMGDYLTTVIPEPDASPSDDYTLEVFANGIAITLAENVQIRNIPSRPYIIRSIETEIIPIIPANIDFDPDTLNLKSKGKWVIVYIELPMGHGYSVGEIDLISVMLNSQVQAKVEPTEIGDYDLDAIPDLMVKFNRSAVQAIFEVEDKVEIIITGELIDGRQLEGSDIIRVISR